MISKIISLNRLQIIDDPNSKEYSLDYLVNLPLITKSTTVQIALQLYSECAQSCPVSKEGTSPLFSTKEYEPRIKWITKRLDTLLLRLIENKDQVGKRSRAGVTQSAYQETTLKHDPEIAAANVGNNIESS